MDPNTAQSSGPLPPQQMSSGDAMILAELRKINASGMLMRPTRTIASGVLAALFVTMLLAFVVGVFFGRHL